MIINALNSGAKVFMADFEDSHDADLGQRRRRARSTCATRSTARSTFASPDGKQYQLNPQIATLIVRPRGWHLIEKHVRSTASPCPAPSSISACTCSTTHAALRARGTRPVLLPAEDREPSRGAALERRVPRTPSARSASRRQTIKATVLIETILAAFEMDEIL